MTDTEQRRANGPAELRKGPVEVAAVVVLDPLGEASHGELPATWRPLTEEVGVVWCRLPAARRLGWDGTRLLSELAGGRKRVHLVGAGRAGLLAVALAMAHRDIVRSLVLVDPPWDAENLRELQRFVDSESLLLNQIQTTTAALPGVGPRPDTSLPIGHPEVVRAIVEVLVAADAGLPEAPAAGPPGAESPATGAWHALRERVGEVLGAFARELGERGYR